MQDPELRKKFVAGGMEPAGNTPAEFTEFRGKQNDRYASIVRQAGVKAD
jgi:tripartite-type tricarboxylate transporter receptor subunit TctC